MKYLSYSMADPSITIRIKAENKEKIQELVDSLKYRSITDFVDKSIREKLEREESESPSIESLQSEINEMKKRIESLESMRVEQIGSTLRIAIDKNKKSG
jgi:Arc/MetJ-type ribon-helix-helix transcriptional regulator